MANPLFERLYGGGNAQNAQQASPQNMQDIMTRLRSNPAMAIRQAGFNVPDEIVNNPQAVVTYLIKSGQVNNALLQRIGPLLNQMTGGKF